MNRAIELGYFQVLPKGIRHDAGCMLGLLKL
jgi:hypothetical protein